MSENETHNLFPRRLLTNALPKLRDESKTENYHVTMSTDSSGFRPFRRNGANTEVSLYRDISYFKTLQKTPHNKYLEEKMVTSKSLKPLLIIQTDSSKNISKDSWMSVYSTVSIFMAGSSLSSVSDYNIHLNKHQKPNNRVKADFLERNFLDKAYNSSDNRRNMKQLFNVNNTHVPQLSEEIIQNEKELNTAYINDSRDDADQPLRRNHRLIQKSSFKANDPCSNHSIYVVVSDPSLTDLSNFSTNVLRNYQHSKIKLMKNDQEVAVSIGKGFKVTDFRMTSAKGSVDNIDHDNDEVSISEDTENSENSQLEYSFDQYAEEIVFDYNSQQNSYNSNQNSKNNSNERQQQRKETLASVIEAMNIGKETNYSRTGLAQTKKSTADTQIYDVNPRARSGSYAVRDKDPRCKSYRIPPQLPECQANLPLDMKCVGGCNQSLPKKEGPRSRSERRKQQEYTRRCTLNLDKMKDVLERLEQKMAVEVISVAVGEDYAYAKYDIDLQTDNVDLNLCCPKRRDICPCLLRRYAKITGTVSEQAIKRKKLRLGPCECSQNHPDSAPGIRLNKKPKPVVCDDECVEVCRDDIENRKYQRR